MTRRLQLSAILLLICLAATAQQPLRRDFWLNEANTPVNVNAIVQDAMGYLWVGADDGLYRFNGREFTKLFDTSSSPVTALAAWRNQVYIGYSSGMLGTVSHDTVVRLSVRGRRPNSTVRCIYTGTANLLWLCSEEGVFAILNNYGMLIDQSSGLSDNFTYSLIACKNNILVGTDQGINNISLKAGRPHISSLNAARGLPDDIVKVIKPGKGPNTVWIGTQDAGIAHWINGRITSYRGTWPWGEINDIIPMTANRAWVATREGYLLDVRLDTGFRVTAYQLGDCKINNIALTRTGNIWCGTNKGITVITAEYVSAVRVQAPYAMQRVTAMGIDNNNALWFALENELYQLPLRDSAQLSKYTLSASEHITCIYADSRDVLWIGTLDRGLWYKLPGKQPVQARGIERLESGSILSITGRDSSIWVAGLNGVEEIAYSNGMVRPLNRYNKQSGIGSDYVYQLYKDRAGNIWMATDGAGICMFDGSQFHTWDATSGFASKVVYGITQDASGYIWAATLGSGIFRYDGVKWRQFTKSNGLQDLNISSVAANRSGQVIIVNQKGIDEWYSGAGDFRHFNSRSGLGIDSLSNVLNCTATDAEGNVYLPYDEGFLIFRNTPNTVDFTPKVSITDVRVFFKSVVSGTHHFAAGAHDITLKFDGISYTYVDRLNYRYKLEGYNNTWISTHDDEATFLELPPGEYRFRVQAALNNSFDKYSEADYYFTIAAPFWKMPWFFALCALAIFGITYLYIRLREQNLRKLSRLQEERMMFEYEHLKSQVNPHFLFNSLNTLASLIEEDRETAVNYTVQLADLYRNILALRNRDLVTLGEEIEILESYVHIQQSRFGNALRVHMDIPPDYMSTKKIVPLSLQLLVENAIKHNVVSQATPLTITITADEDEITVRNTLLPKYKKEKSSGLGLVNIYKRYRLLTKRKLTYGPDNNEYVVKLPLL